MIFSWLRSYPTYSLPCKYEFKKPVKSFINWFIKQIKIKHLHLLPHNLTIHEAFYYYIPILSERSKLLSLDYNNRCLICRFLLFLIAISLTGGQFLSFIISLMNYSYLNKNVSNQNQDKLLPQFQSWMHVLGSRFAESIWIKLYAYTWI